MLFFLTILMFCVVHGCAWYGSNYQLMFGGGARALGIAVMAAVPTAFGAYYATKFGYEHFSNLWSVRMMGFACSWLVFPMLTWLHLEETPFAPKTMLSIALSMGIVGVQLFMK